MQYLSRFWSELSQIIIRVIQNIKKYLKISSNTRIPLIYDLIDTQKSQLILSILRGLSSLLKKTKENDPNFSLNFDLAISFEPLHFFSIPFPWVT